MGMFDTIRFDAKFGLVLPAKVTYQTKDLILELAQFRVTSEGKLQRFETGDLEAWPDFHVSDDDSRILDPEFDHLWKDYDYTYRMYFYTDYGKDGWIEYSVLFERGVIVENSFEIVRHTLPKK